MEHFPAPLTRAESDAMFERLREHEARHGFGPWVVETRHEGAFAGLVGLSIPSWDAPFRVDGGRVVEIMWRLRPSSWGQGFATEGARAALQYGFGTLDLAEIVSFTVPHNTRSRAVMARLGMTHDRDGTFDHPRLPSGDPLQRHVLYRLHRRDWENEH